MFLNRLIDVAFDLACGVSGYPVYGSSVQSDGISSGSAIARGVVRTVSAASHSSGTARRSPSSAVPAHSSDAVASGPLVRVVSAVSGATACSCGREASSGTGVTVRILRPGIRVASGSSGSSNVTLSAATAAASGENVGVRSDGSSAAPASSAEYVSGIAKVQRDAARERYRVSTVGSVVSVSVTPVPAGSVYSAVVYEIHHASGRKGSHRKGGYRRRVGIYGNSSVHRYGRVQREGLVPSRRNRLVFEVVVRRVRSDSLRESERSLRA